MSKKTKKMYSAMLVHKNPQTSYGSMTLPKGCIGIIFVFSTKGTALSWEGRNTKLSELVLDVPRSKMTTTKSSKS